MKPEEFIQRLSAKYPAKCTEPDKEDTLLWLNQINMGTLKLQVYYKKVIRHYNHQHRYFPDMPTLLKIYSEASYTDRHNDNTIQQCIEDTQDWPIRRIVDAVHKMRDNECPKCGTHCTTQVLFVSTWEMLACWYSHLKSKGWEESRILSYCETIKQAIIRGEEVGQVKDVMDTDIITASHKKRLPGETDKDWDARKNRVI